MTSWSTCLDVCNDPLAQTFAVVPRPWTLHAEQAAKGVIKQMMKINVEFNTMFLYEVDD